MEKTSKILNILLISIILTLLLATIALAEIDGGQSTVARISDPEVQAGDDNVALNLTLRNSTGSYISGSFNVTISAIETGDWLNSVLTEFDGGNATINLTITETGTYEDVNVSVQNGSWIEIGTFNVNITASDPSTITVIKQPSNTIAGEVISPAPGVNVTDQYGNPVLGVNVTVTLNKGSFAGGTFTVPTNASGVAVFDDLNITVAGVDYNLTFNSTGVADVTSDFFNVTAANPGSVDFENIMASQVAGIEFDVAGNISNLNDSFGNVVEDSTYNVTIMSDLQGEVYSNDSFAFTGGSPVGVILLNLTAAGGHTLTLTVEDATNTSTVTILAGDAVNVTVQTQPTETVAGTPIAGPPQALVQDTYANPVAGVTVSVVEVGGYVFDSGNLTQSTDASGIATFGDLVIITANTSYALNFSIDAADGNVGTSDEATSNTFDVVAAAAAEAILIQEPTNTTAGEPISPAPAVRVQDNFGNPVANVNVTVTEQGGYNFDVGGGTLNTSAEGIAAFGLIIINNASTNYQLVFDIDAAGVANVTSGLFNVTPAAINSTLSSVLVLDSPKLPNQTINLSVSLKDDFGNDIDDLAEVNFSFAYAGNLSNTLSEWNFQNNLDGTYNWQINNTAVIDSVNVTVTVGGVELNETGPLVWDGIPPVTTINATLTNNSDYVEDTWTTQNVTINLTCDDVGSGCYWVNYTLYGIGGHSEQGALTYEFLLENPGIYVVNYYSVDQAVNIEIPTNNFTVKIASPGPESIGGSWEFPDDATPESAPNVTVHETFNVTVMMEDGNSTTITLPQGTVVTATNGSNINLTAMNSANVSLDVLSGLASNLNLEGNAIQFGILGWGLSFSKNVTIKLFVGHSYNGTTLDIRRSTTGDGDWTQTGINPSSCTVEAGICEFNISQASYFATTTTSPEEETTEPSVSSSSAAPPPDFVSVGDSRMEQGYARNMREGQGLRFNVNGVGHSLTVGSVTGDSVTVTVSSDPQTRVLSVGEEWKVDVNSDGWYDLLVRLDGINGAWAELFVVSIREEISVEQEEEVVVLPVEEEEEVVVLPAEEEEEEVIVGDGSFNWWFVVVALVVVVVLFLVFSPKKSVRKH